MAQQVLLYKKVLFVDSKAVNVMILEQLLQEVPYKIGCGLTDPAHRAATKSS